MSKSFLSDLGRDVLDSIRADANERLSEAALEERIINIKKATLAMMEANVNEETVIKMLQKHWDLRLSEAREFIENAKSL